MKPLVYYCRWQEASLRLQGRDDTAVWGQLVFKTGSEEEWLQPFRYELNTQRLFLETPGGKEILQLDEMGTVQQ